jgi:hypothetical protein
MSFIFVPSWICSVTLLSRIINSISFIVAIPYTILYKLITGNKPPSKFATGPNAIRSPSNPLNIAKGTIMVLQSTWSSIITALTTEMETIDKEGAFLRWPSFAARIIKCVFSTLCARITVCGADHLALAALIYAFPSSSLDWVAILR